jgi:hypothetical protein
MHGTTIGTNAVLEHEGAVTGMIATAGYRDITHIGRHQRPQHYSIRQEVPWQDRPLAKRRHRLTVAERIVPPKGEVLVPLDEAAVRHAARVLKEAGVEYTKSTLRETLREFTRPFFADGSGPLAARCSVEAAPQRALLECARSRSGNSMIGVIASLGSVSIWQAIVCDGLCDRAGGTVSQIRPTFLDSTAKTHPVHEVVAPIAAGSGAGPSSGCRGQQHLCVGVVRRRQHPSELGSSALPRS